MGAVAGAIASGRVPAGGEAGDPWTSWVNPASIVGGVLAVTAGAYLAAVYLIWDARRLADDPMVEYFRRRAIIAAVVAGAVAFVGIFVLRADARYLFDGLTSRALPLVVLSGGRDPAVDGAALRAGPTEPAARRGRGFPSGRRRPQARSRAMSRGRREPV
jgi:cytochrome d ubiquinol oxidase subunit II